VDLGDQDGDSLLRSIAAGLLDKMLKQGNLDKSVVRELITRYLARFPEDRKISTNANPIERLQQLLQHIRLGKLTQRIAYVLGQIIAEEFSKNEEYAHLVVNGELVKTAITEDGGWDAIIALSTALPQLPLEVQIIEPNKTLFKRATFNTAKQNPNSVVLQVNNGYYQPRLGSSTFNSIVLLPVSGLNGVESSTESSTLPIASTEEECMVSTFEEVYRPLCAMVAAGELDVRALTEIYVKSTAETCETSSRKRFRADIFDGVVATQNNALPRNRLPSDGPAQFAKYLAYSISKAVGFGEMNKDEVFSLVDAKQSTGVGASR
jgi:hypothetical protein